MMLPHFAVRNACPQGRPSRRQASALVLVTVFMVALFGFGSLSVDVGNVLLQRKKLHEATDAAAMAAVVDWFKGATPNAVEAMGQAFAVTNGALVTEILAVEPGTWDQASSTFTGPLSTLPPNTVPAVRVTGRRHVDTPFWRVVSFGAADAMRPFVESIAAVGTANAAANAMPWTVCDTFVPAKCLSVTLQFKSGGETNACSSIGPLSGNFGQLTLPGNSGASWYKNNIAYGYQGTLRVGQCVDTDPGVSWGPTRQGINTRIGGLPAYTCTADSAPPPNARLGIIPKTDNLDVSGKKKVCITGFYVVSLDGYSNSKKTVTATFLEAFGGTEVDPSTPPTPGGWNGVTLVR
ncbi:hypothetical protein HQ590_15310 [bacterium]|nr:hypothetical protein [bacterium]